MSAAKGIARSAKVTTAMTATAAKMYEVSGIDLRLS